MKVTRMRAEQEMRESSKDNGKDYVSVKSTVGLNDRVSFVDPDGIKRIGYVDHITKHKDPRYEVACNGQIYDIASVRKMEPNPDLSHVVSADVLKNVSTKRLLDLFRLTQYSGYHSCGVHVGGAWVVPIQLKKELNTREHIETKQERAVKRKKGR